MSKLDELLKNHTRRVPPAIAAIPATPEREVAGASVTRVASCSGIAEIAEIAGDAPEGEISHSSTEPPSECDFSRFVTLASLRAIGLKLEAGDDQLIVSPGSLLTAALSASIRESKPRLLAELAREAAGHYQVGLHLLAAFLAGERIIPAATVVALTRRFPQIERSRTRITAYGRTGMASTALLEEFGYSTSTPVKHPEWYWAANARWARDFGAGRLRPSKKKGKKAKRAAPMDEARLRKVCTFDGSMPARTGARWEPLERSDGAVAIVTYGVITHSITRTVAGTRTVALAWDWSTAPATLLGRYDTVDEAREACGSRTTRWEPLARAADVIALVTRGADPASPEQDQRPHRRRDVPGLPRGTGRAGRRQGA